MSRCYHPHAGRSGSTTILVTGALAATALLFGGAYFYFTSTAQDSGPMVLTAVASKGPFEHVVLEQGEVESSSNVDVICEVKSRNSTGTAILWVVDEGTQVNKGDKLVELDSSALELELKQQRVVVANAEATKIGADSTLETAKVAKLEYLEGTFTQEEKLVLSEILIAEEKLSRARETAKYSERLAALGFQTTLQLKADQFAVEQATVELELAQSKLKTLREITKQKMLIQLDADIEKAKAQLDAAVNSLKEEQDKLTDIEQQIKKCIIYAPEAGVVVHGNKTSSRGGNAEFVVEPGAMVRERQVVIRLPDPSKMQIKAKVNESHVPMLKEGMPASIQIGAFEDAVLRGVVTKVNKYAEPTSWFSSEIKEYATFIQIVDPPKGVRTGMTAEVRIFVERLTDALQIPVQALYEKKGHLFCLVATAPNAFETREVQIGAANDKFATIKSGLSDGDKVVLNPRAHEEKMDKTVLDVPDVPLPPGIPDTIVNDGPSSAPALPGQEPSPGLAGAGAPGAGGPGAGGPGPGPGAGAPGAGRPGGPGGFGRGAGGPPPSAEAMVEQTMQRLDADSDGMLSEEEMSSLPEQFRSAMMGDDTNGDGKVDRAELTAGMTKRFARMQGGGGPPGGGPPGAGGPGGGAP